MNPSILLLNPPSKNNLQRDFICSSSSKANYYWPPIDLVVLSGLLKDYKVYLLDAIVEKLPSKDVLNLVKKNKFDYIISLVSSIEFEKEYALLTSIKSIHPRTKIIVIGDIAFFERDRIIKMKNIDAILLNFTSHEITKYLDNPREKKILDMVYKNGSKKIFNGFSKAREFSYNQANFDLFKLDKYVVPYSVHHSIAPILFNYGCPYSCSFCSSGRIGYSLRNLEESKREIRDIFNRGFKEMFIRDFNFTTNKNFVKEICKFIIDNKISLIWSCEARVDNVDCELLSLMKKAGCYLIFFGVETPSQKKLSQFHKNITPQQIIEIFKICRKLGIKSLASFILALPGDTREDMLETIKFARKIGADYASFNLYVPRYGSVLREKLKKDKRISSSDKFDSSTEFVNLTSLSNNEIKKLHQYALRTFYFRPAYLLKKLTEIKTFFQFKNHFLNGFSLFKKVLP